MATNVAHGKAKREGIISLLTRIYNKGGVQALYTGFQLSIVGIVGYRAVYFGFFDTAKGLMYETGQKKSFFKMFAVAQLTTNCASFLVYPTDTVSRRMML